MLAYRVEDSDTGRLRGTLYLDLYRRKHKDGGAWMNPTVNRHVSAEGTRLPVVYIVCNAPKDKAATPTFTFDEVVTLFHEMGHALHNLLTEVDEEFFSGLAHVEHDAVELPSQFMENFCWDYSVLERMTAHVDTGAPLPKEDFDQLKATRLFMAASGVLHSARLSLMDLTLHLNSLPANDFTLTGYTPQSNLNRVSVGLSQSLAPGLALRGGYNWRKSDELTQQGVNLALSLEF